VTVDSILGGSEERLELFLLGEVEERLEDGIFMRIFEIVVNDVNCSERIK
jgi:hypothetical protein